MFHRNVHNSLYNTKTCKSMYSIYYFVLRALFPERLRFIICQQSENHIETICKLKFGTISIGQYGN